MKHDKSKTRVLVGLLSLGFLAVGSGCSDSDYDLSKTDMTIGIGSDCLELPVSSTENIMLDDILDLNSSDLVKIADNGDYIFEKDGGESTPARPSVAKVTVMPQSINDKFRVDISLPSSLSASRKKAVRRKVSFDDMTFEGKVAEFDYSGSTPKEILSLSSAGVSSAVSITVKPSESLKACVPSFKSLTLSLPPYMTLDITSCSSAGYTYDKATGKLTLKNVSSASPIYVKGNIVALDFSAKSSVENELSFAAGSGSGTVKMRGEVKTGVTINEVNVDGAIPSDLYLEASMSMGNISINSAKGRFAPEIDLGEIGHVDINNVPDFLTGDDVKINLYNPFIVLSVSSNIGVAGKLSGKIIAEDKSGHTLAAVSVPEMTIKPHSGTAGGNTVTKICICKNASLVDKSQYDEVNEVSDLSELLFTIPKTLRFEANASADATKEAEISLGTKYEIAPHYTFSAPLAFDEGASIVYRDVIDGWNDDIDKLDFADGAYIELSADVENRMPAYLNVSAGAVGVDGKEISSGRIEVGVSNSIKASSDGATAETTSLTITLKEKQKGALKSVDGLKFRIEAASGENGSKSIVGQTINAYRHTLTARNIKVKLVGKIIADLN